MRRSVTLVVGAAVSVVGVLVAAALWYSGWPTIRRDSTITAATLFDLLKLVFSVVAGVGGVAALVVAYRRQRVAEHANLLAEFAHALARSADLRAEAAEYRAKIETDRNGVRLFNERFAKASEQLGSDKAAVRLAGVYAMAGLADDWQEGRQTCIDVLCAYLRMPYTPPIGSDSTASVDVAATREDAQEERLAREEQEVRHTVIRLISAHLRLDEGELTSWRGLNLDFTGAVFDGGDFLDVTFSGGRVSFDRATFCGSVSFAGATFSGGAVTFYGASFSRGRVHFSEAAFSGGNVSFDRATFSGGQVFFAEVSVSSGRLAFEEATFSGGELYFNASTFSGGNVSFFGANFDSGKVEFGSATFSGAEVNFMWATFSGGRVSFRNATYSGGLVDLVGVEVNAAPPLFDSWPEGLPPESLHLPGK
ncbi:pentapeptide repeat-containing protein [Micromonospora saelicesensis]|uniref:pentapeptide repeat-containing protein n=1 Tax=Micromonospora saelicesensis TaxID=285676 RepID=UPI000DD82125|nr:pentapeptide repeat-containing protein [Micromonospora saelicesensis]